MPLAQRVALRHISAKSEIVAVVPVEGKSGTRKHKVVLKTDHYGRGGLVVSVQGTPGNWDLQDFMRGRGPLAIDFGQNWILDNADDIRRAIQRMDLDNLAGGADEEAVREIALALKGVSQDLSRKSQALVNELMDALKPVDQGLFYTQLVKEYPALTAVMDQLQKVRGGLMDARTHATLMGGEADRVLR